MSFHRRQRGFTMLEVLLAMGIFVIGFAMVATIFPSAILLQKRTIEDVQGQQAARNAEASIRARKFDRPTLIARMSATYGSVSPYWDDDGRVYALPPEYLDSTYVAGLDEWMLADRSYPVKRANAPSRKFYWTPLVRDVNQIGGNYSLTIYIFVLKRRQTDTYPRFGAAGDWANYWDGYVDVAPAGLDANDYWTVPGVYKQAVVPGATGSRLDFANTDADGDGVPDLLKENDRFLDNNGNIYTVAIADVNGIDVSGTLSNTPNTISEIWFSPPGDLDQPSPTVDIFSLSDTEAME